MTQRAESAGFDAPSTCMRHYTRVGSQKTPEAVGAVMTRLARYLESRGYILRSGGADGADAKFEAGASEAMREIYLPWRGFNKNTSKLIGPSDAAIEIGDRFHPLLASLDRGSDLWRSQKIQGLRKLMGRNVHQVLGQQLDLPSAFTVCWTKDAADGVVRLTSAASGGTGQAIRISAAHGVPVYNLADPAVMGRILKKLDSVG